MDNRTTYEGWTNFETFSFWIWLSNTQHVYNHWLDKASQSENYLRLSELMYKTFSMDFSIFLGEPYSTLAQYAFDNINFDEIAVELQGKVAEVLDYQSIERERF